MWLIVLVAIIIFAFFYFKNYLYKTRKSYVLEHSTAIQTIKEINNKYAFKHIQNFDMTHNYDNEAFYQTISPEDYLIYQLVYKSHTVRSAIKDARENKRLYKLYQNQISCKCVLGQLTVEIQPQEKTWLRLKEWLRTNVALNQESLFEMEKDIFDSLIIKPKTSLEIIVKLRQTNIQDTILTYKSSKFNEEEIEQIINRLSNKYNGRYLDNEIWQSICRVERGRVSNKMRFSIYERDGHRCKKCGKYSNNLEIDHIFPISKGGKSEYDNLQTLCHECNIKKSNNIERGAIYPKSQRFKTNISCELCGAPMVIVKGKYGDFYGCSNYPNCRFTKEK